MTGRDADGHGLAVALAHEMEWDVGAQQLHGRAQQLSLVAHGEGYSVRAWGRGTGLASGVHGLCERDAGVQVLTDDDVVAEGGRERVALTVMPSGACPRA